MRRPLTITLASALALLLAAASIVNRSGGPSPFGELPYMACLSLDVPSWEPEDCPLCASGEHGPAIKPGSRPGL